MTNTYVRKIINIVIILLGILILWYNFVNINNEDQYIKLFGYRLMVVQEFQEQDGINKNDIIIGKVSEQGYTSQDLIIVRANNTIYFRRIIDITEEGYITKGDGNYRQDSSPITDAQIEGRVVKKIPKLGGLLNVIKSKVFSVIVLIILILLFVYNSHIYKKRIKRRFIKTHGSK